MSRTQSQGRVNGSRKKKAKSPSKPAARVNLKDLGKVDIRELNQVCHATKLDVARGVYLGPRAHSDLFREAERRIARLRGELTPIAYDRLRTMLMRLRKVLTDRVNYFALKGRYREAIPAAS